MSLQLYILEAGYKFAIVSTNIQSIIFFKFPIKNKVKIAWKIVARTVNKSSELLDVITLVIILK